MTTSDKQFCECGRHYYNHIIQMYCALISSGVVIVRPHAWPKCVLKLHEQRLAASEAPTQHDITPVRADAK